MSLFINTETGEYPVSLQTLISRYPNTSFPSTAVDFHPYAVVHESSIPPTTADQKIIETYPQLQDGIWVKQYQVQELTDLEKQNRLLASSKHIRTKRNQLLSESDWTQLPDSKVDKEAWLAYRQALRDLTLQPGFPHQVVWPTKPE